MRLEHAIDTRITDATDQFRIGQITAVIGAKLIVSVAGTSKTIPRLATWTPTAGDLVLIAVTSGGWIALGPIA